MVGSNTPFQHFDADGYKPPACAKLSLESCGGTVRYLKYELKIWSFIPASDPARKWGRPSVGPRNNIDNIKLLGSRQAGASPILPGLWF